MIFEADDDEVEELAAAPLVEFIPPTVVDDDDADAAIPNLLLVKGVTSLSFPVAVPTRSEKFKSVSLAM